MKNSNLVLRTLTCVIGIPLLACLIFLLPQYNFIGLRLLLVASCVLGSIEMSKMLYGKITVLPLVSTILPIICIFFPEDAEFYLALLLITTLGLEIRGGERDNFENTISRVGKRMLCIVYPSYFLTFPIRFTALEGVNSYLIAYYIVLVFANDIFAYVFGMAFGKNNNAHLKASPKKSYAGFAGGFASCIILSLVYTGLFNDKSICFNELAFRIICPVIISAFADIGDLIESCIKRSAKVKDSSNLIPGHGGVLDRLDSILVTAPVFYFLIRDMLI